MSEKDDIEEVLRARIVADALTGGDIDALIDLSDLLEASGTPEKIRTFVLQLLFELLSDAARDTMAAAAAGGHSNVIDFSHGSRGIDGAFERRRRWPSWDFRKRNKFTPKGETCPCRWY